MNCGLCQWPSSADLFGCIETSTNHRRTTDKRTKSTHCQEGPSQNEIRIIFHLVADWDYSLVLCECVGPEGVALAQLVWVRFFCFKLNFWFHFGLAKVKNNYNLNVITKLCGFCVLRVAWRQHVLSKSTIGKFVGSFVKVFWVWVFQDVFKYFNGIFSFFIIIVFCGDGGINFLFQHLVYNSTRGLVWSSRWEIAVNWPVLRNEHCIWLLPTAHVSHISLDLSATAFASITISSVF